MSKNTEAVFNILFAQALMEKSSLFRETGAEQTRVFDKNPAQRPDICISIELGSPVVIETEFLPANSVEKDADARLGKSVEGDEVKVIALCIPEVLREYQQNELGRAIQKEKFTYCLFDTRATAKRWPEKGWIKGDINALATLIENASTSELLIEKSIEYIEEGVNAAASSLSSKTERKPDVREEIVKILRQEYSEQTARMAMTILLNALVFQNIIAGVHKVKNIEELKGKQQVLRPKNTQANRPHLSILYACHARVLGAHQ